MEHSSCILGTDTNKFQIFLKLIPSRAMSHRVVPWKVRKYRDGRGRHLLPPFTTGTAHCNTYLRWGLYPPQNKLNYCM